MVLSKVRNEQLAVLSRQLLSAMHIIEKAAKLSLGSGKSLDSADVFVSIGKPILGQDLAAHHLVEISYENRQGLLRISGEPFVAYILAEDDAGERSRFYFARGSLFADIENLSGRLVSYRSPLGRLAEFAAGESITVRLPDRVSKEFKILERVRLYPVKEARGWDGTDDNIEQFDLLLQLQSLLDFLAPLETEVSPEDVYGQLLDAANRARNVREGLRRKVIGRMSLRDQPILDRYQGEIFRLPLDRRLFLSGAPGTGKTTTLIRRLAQKRSVDDISDEELELLAKDQYSKYFHPNNWLMFTPTELLRLYLKEAFSKEGIASPDARIRTWAEHRRLIGRDIFRVLRSESGGKLVLDDEKENMIGIDSRSMIDLVEDFQEFFRSYLVKRYHEALNYLGDNADSQLREILDQMQPPDSGEMPAFDDLFSYYEFHQQLREHTKRLAGACKDDFSALFNQFYRKNRTILADLEAFLKTIALEPEILDEDVEEETGDDEEEYANLSEGRLIAVEAFRRAIYARATSTFEKRTISRTSRNWKILDWFDRKYREELNLEALGERLAKLRRLRFLSTTHKNLIDLVPSVYQRFRRTRHQEHKWYCEDAILPISRGRINGSELDVMLYLMLNNARKYLSQSGFRMLQEDTHIAMLESLKAEYVTQILVDEVTDFSPIQVACMMELAEPKFRSCFMCGDVLQRVTRWGISNISEFNWIAKDCEVKEVTIGYRMSGNLMDLAMAVASVGGGKKPRLRAAAGAENLDISPILREGLMGRELAIWLCNRIQEIERNIGAVPSIAIFVDGDDKIDPLLDDLKPLLAEHNLEVIGCKEGQFMGTESKIRIFDIQYVKGLEFEAVFFVDVDHLVKKYPGLYDKFLFVGITRAATFLALTCSGALPVELARLRPHLSMGEWEPPLRHDVSFDKSS